MINELEQTLDFHFLYPASLFVSMDPHIVSTILGSCVAVCFYDTKLKYGGLNHYMLPLWNGQGLASPKYGNIAIERLLNKMYTLGSKKENIVSKVFGGGEVIKSNIDHYRVGERNIKIALSILEELKISVVAQSTGGKNGRKILFYTHTGMIKQKLIANENFT